MKNYLKIGLLLIVTLFVALQSCEKKEILNELNDEAISNTDKSVVDKNYDITDVEFEYYFNENKIKSNPFDLKDNKNSNMKNIMVVFEKIEKGKKKRITINSFDTDEAYILWGKRRGIPVDEMLSKETRLIEFIERNNIDDIYEKTGKLPKKYIEYENKILKNNNKIIVQIFIHKDFVGGDTWAVFNTIPTLKWTAWNNEISRYQDHDLYGGVSWYDKSWYSNRMATTWNIGWKFIRFQGPLSYLNDKTTSLINW